MNDISSRLADVCVAVPESRQLDTMVQLLERRGAQVLRVPLVAIHDAPDPGPVLDWIRRFINKPPDLFIIFTGEGVKRLLSLAERNRLKSEFVSALQKTTLLCRGPKPDRALRDVGLKGDLGAVAPTTEGVIESLKHMPIDGQAIAIQMYGNEPNTKLMNYLESRDAAIDVVAPYIYAVDTEEALVLDLINAMIEGTVDVVTFTSQPQYHRLRQVAKKHNLFSSMKNSLNACCVGAIGPLVKNQLEEDGIKVDVMPEQAFFMKPLVTEIMRFIAAKQKDKGYKA